MAHDVPQRLNTSESMPKWMDTSPSMAKYVPTLAPIVLIAIGYMDPGNWASAIEGGSRFGFELVWVVILSNAMAALFQTLATRLGLVSGKHLAEICREDYPRPVCLLLWLLSEVSIIALDLTMVVGTAVGLNLLFGFPMLPSILLLAFDGIILMVALPIVGVHRAELVAGCIVGVVILCFGLGTLLCRPSASAIFGGMWPKVRGDSLYTAVGLIGANVVPHTFYLHSALLQGQHNLESKSKEIFVQENMRDTIGSFGIAMLANLAVLMVAASTFHNVGLVILTLQDAYALMEQILSNSTAPVVFGLALICAAQLSSLTGTLTGKVTMEGFLDMSMRPWLHRSLVRGAAVIPAALCAWHYGSEGLYQLLLFAQIIIAVELPFSAVPLIKASASETRMGSYKIPSIVESAAWISVALVVFANIWLVFDVLLDEIDEFSGFAAHLESLLGTDSFGHYGEDTLNTSVFALVLISIGVCIGFLIWLVVTPLRIDRIAMERKWVQEYELFERNEVMRENEDLADDPMRVLEYDPDPGITEVYDMIPIAQEIMSANDLLDLEYPSRTENTLSGRNSDPALELGREELGKGELVTWPSTISTSSSDIDDIVSKPSELPYPSEPVHVHDLSRTSDLSTAAEPFVPAAKKLVSDPVLISADTPHVPDNELPLQVVEPPVEVTLVNQSQVSAAAEAVVHDLNSTVKSSEDGKLAKSLLPPDNEKLDVAMDITSPGHDRSHVLTEPEIAGTIETFLKDASFPAKKTTETKKSRSNQGSIAVRRQVSLAADDVESIALKKAEAEADADLIEKDDDEVDDLEHGNVVVGPLSYGTLGHSYNNLAYEGSGSARSLGARSDISEGSTGGSGSGSLSRLSGLGRAARRQFAAYLDEFWGKLFDLHGQPIAIKGNTRSNATVSTAGPQTLPFDNSCITPGPVDPGAYLARVSSPADVCLGGENNGYSLRNQREPLKSASSLHLPVDPHLMDAYARAQSHNTATTSSGFPVLTHDFAVRSGSLGSPFLPERQYSSMRLPSYSEEIDRQPATIHGYHVPSFLGGRSATSSPSNKSSRPMSSLEVHGSESVRTLSGQASVQQPLGIGVQRDFEKSLYGAGFSGSLEDTIQSFRSMNALPSRSAMGPQVTGERDLNGPRSWDSRMTTLDPLVYRATGELYQPSSSHSPIGRLGSTSRGGAPLSFDDLSPSVSHRDGFSIQSAQSENSLWSRQPFDQLFGGVTERTTNGEPGRSRGGSGSMGSSRTGSINDRSGKTGSGSDSLSNASTAFRSWPDTDLEMMDNLRTCICKLLCLEGSEWLFRFDNGSDEDLVAAVAAVEKMHLEADAPDRVSRNERWQAHGRPVSSLLKGNNEARRVSYCSESCVWGKGLLVSFGVWCVHRVLELSLMESRPELWGKYTYVLNRLQGVLEPAFSKLRLVAPMCNCVLEVSEILNMRAVRGSLIKQGSNSFRVDSLSGDHSNSPQSSYPYPWSWGRNSSSTKGKGASASVFLEMIKEVEQAVGSRKGRTGTAAGDVAFPKGKENLASVLKRYKRRLGNKPPGAAAGGGGGGGAGGGTGGSGRRSNNGYVQSLVFAACL